MDFLITYLLPLIYALIAGRMLTASRFLVDGGISPKFSLLFLYTKIFTGLFYTWVMLRFIPSAAGDIEVFYGGGLEMYHYFWSDPAGFPSYLAKTFSISDFRIGRTDSDFIRTVFDGIKFIHFLLNFFSGGHLFTNVLLFNCLASWLFLRCWVYLRQIFGNVWMGAWLFIFPSAFFFTSVILKEGIEMCLIAAIIPILAGLGQNGNIGRYFLLFLLALLLFFFKYLIAATFFASLTLYMVFRRFPGKKGWVTAGAVMVFLIVFFGAVKLHPGLNLPQYIIDRRVEFQTLEANSALPMRDLRPELFSFLAALPEALNHVLFKPLPGEGGKLMYIVFSAEMLFFWLILVFIGVKARKTGYCSPGAEAWALLLFGLVNLLIIGYTITNIGAITRYRSIFLPGIGYFVWMLCRGHLVLAGWNRFLNRFI